MLIFSWSSIRQSSNLALNEGTDASFRVTNNFDVLDLDMFGEVVQ